MTDPVSAAEVEKQTEKDADELRRERSQLAVRGRLARREALVRTGGLVSTATPAGLEDRLRDLEQRQMASFRERRNP